MLSTSTTWSFAKTHAKTKTHAVTTTPDNTQVISHFFCAFDSWVLINNSSLAFCANLAFCCSSAFTSAIGDWSKTAGCSITELSNDCGVSDVSFGVIISFSNFHKTTSLLTGSGSETELNASLKLGTTFSWVLSIVSSWGVAVKDSSGRFVWGSVSSTEVISSLVGDSSGVTLVLSVASTESTSDKSWFSSFTGEESHKLISNPSLVSFGFAFSAPSNTGSIVFSKSSMVLIINN